MSDIPNIDPIQAKSINLTPVEARQGMMTGRMRYVLGVSLLLSVAVMVIIFAV